MSIPEDVKNFLEEVDQFLSDSLGSEKALGKKTKDRRETLLKTLKQIKSRYQDAFTQDAEADAVSSEAASVSSRGDSHADASALGGDSVHDEATGADVYVQLPAISASDILNVIKTGFLDKKRKDHSFFVGEWQRRWCVLSSTALYYYGDKKDKQQKGAVPLCGYWVRPVDSGRKDRKESAFEIAAPDKRCFQFSASSPDDARSWIGYIRQVIRDCRSSVIQEEAEDDDGDFYDDIDPMEPVKPKPATSAATPAPIDEDIYELLPDDDEEDQPPPEPPRAIEPPPLAPKPVSNSGTKVSDTLQAYEHFYQGLWDCSAESSDELSFQRGDLVHILSKEYDAFRWWVGELNGTVGLVPKDYLMAAYETERG